MDEERRTDELPEGRASAPAVGAVDRRGGAYHSASDPDARGTMDGETVVNRTLDRYASLPKWPLALGGAVAITAAVVGGLAAPEADRTMVLLPVAVAIGLAALVLAATRFEVFVGCILFVRASIDTIDFGSRTLDAAGAISVLFVGASCLWLLARQEDSAQPTSPVAGLLPPIAALFLCALISVLFSEHPLESLVEVVRFGTLIVIVATLGRVVRDERSMRFVLIAALGSAIVPLLVAFRQITGGGGVFTASGLGRVRGTFLHSNPFAAYLFLMIILAVSLYPHVERRWKLVLGPLTIACGVCLTATYARGPGRRPSSPSSWSGSSRTDVSSGSSVRHRSWRSSRSRRSACGCPT